MSNMRIRRSTHNITLALLVRSVTYGVRLGHTKRTTFSPITFVCNIFLSEMNWGRERERHA
jgi:hypothetical protein